LLDTPYENCLACLCSTFAADGFAAAAIAGGLIQCTDAISLVNTGRVRLVIDDITIDSAVGSPTVTCKQQQPWQGGASISNLNLTAVNATLLPNETLTCSFTATPDQTAFEAGFLGFDVRAVGVAAYGTRPDIAGVVGGVISNATNITLAREANVTVTSSTIGTVTQAGKCFGHGVVC